MSFKQKILCIVLSLFTTLSFADSFFGDDTKEYASFMDKGFVVKADASYSYNAWIPNKSYLLDYSTKGLPLAKFDTEITFKRIFPTVRVSWETAYFDMNNIGNPRGLFIQHEKNDGLKSSYNKIKGIVGLGRILGNNFYNQHYNPWRTNSNVSLYYNRETFRIGVSPRVEGLRYCDFEGDLIGFPPDKTIYQYTKFEEMGVDINSNGKMILPAIFSLLFINSNSSMDFGITNLDTTIGPYFSMWQKPYSVTQIISDGSSNGSEKDIYSARFTSFGAVEKWCYAGEYFYFNNKINWGFAIVQLTKSRILQDNTSPIFMQFNIEPEFGVHLPLLNHHCILSCYASGNWGCLLGVTISSDEDEILAFSSFINSDVILKGTVAITFLL